MLARVIRFCYSHKKGKQTFNAYVNNFFLSFFLSPQLFHGIDIQAQDNDGFTAFHLAAREGNTKVLQTLLDTGIIRSIF